MSKRYSKLFSLPENLYTETSPVIILAGALLKDTQTGKILAQLKFKNIDRKNIKALTVKLSPLDTTQKPLGEEVSHQYLDLNAPRDIEFGEKEPILLPDTSTRAFSASVTEVVFSDSTIWTADIRNTWTVIPSPIPLETALGDKELVKQYQIKYGGFCQCMFQKERDLWRCSCGEINHADEPICNRCKKEKDILSTVNLEELKKEKEERLIAESKYAAEKREAAVAHSKKVKKRIIKNAPICILLIAIIIMVSNNLKKTSEYNKALDLMEAKDYIQAASIFEKLDNYKDSNEQYQTAIKKAFPLKPIYEVVSKDGNAQEQIKLLGLRNTSFSGHELALDFVDSNQIKSTIYVKDLKLPT